MRVREAAELLGISQDTVLRRVQQGDIVGRKIRGTVLLNRASVEALLPSSGPELRPFDQVRALLPQLTADERIAVAREALT